MNRKEESVKTSERIKKHNESMRSPEDNKKANKHITKVLKRKANEARTSHVLAQERKAIKKANKK